MTVNHLQDIGDCRCKNANSNPAILYSKPPLGWSGWNFGQVLVSPSN